MGRKDRKASPDPPKDAASYYRLNTAAVDDLVNATPENSPKVSEAELRKYRSGPQIHLKDWLKTLLIKWWFYGAVCFFFFWGLGTVITHWGDQLLVLGLAVGFVTDLMINNILRYYAKLPGSNDRWMMFGMNRFISLPLNIVYGMVLLGCVVLTYNTVNGVIVSFTGNTESVPLGVEPILFGLFTTGWDFLFLGFRRMGKRILSDARRSNQPNSR